MPKTFTTILIQRKGKIRKSKGYNKEREQQQSYKLSISLGGNTIVHVASE